MRRESIAAKEFFQATEASEEDGASWITLLKEGVSVNNRNYKRASLEKAVRDRVYEGVRMFADHSDKPPLKRSVMHLISGIEETRLNTDFPDGQARVRGKVRWIDEDFQKKAERAKEFIGVSHDSKLFGSRSMKNGRRYEDIDEIVNVHSVDWVIYPSAGGGFEEFYGREGVEMADIDWDAIDEDALKEHKPDLYKQLVDRAKESEEDPDDDDEDDEDSSKESIKSTAKKSKATVLDEHAVEGIVSKALGDYFSKKQTEKQVADKISAQVGRSTLPDLTKKRVIASFDGTESYSEDRVKEAIKSAEDELAAVAGPKVRGAGPSSSGGKDKKHSLGRAHESVEAAFAVGMTKKKVSSKKSAVKDPDDDEEDEEE